MHPSQPGGLLSQHTIVFDLETVPCTETLARLHGREALTDDEAAEIRV